MKRNLCLMFRMNVSSAEHQFTITLYTYAHNQDAHEMFSKTLQCNPRVLQEEEQGIQ